MYIMNTLIGQSSETELTKPIIGSKWRNTFLCKLYLYKLNEAYPLDVCYQFLVEISPNVCENTYHLEHGASG